MRFNKWFMANLSNRFSFCDNRQGQSAVELAIFGSILIFVISLIFRQGLSGGNFMRNQLQASRYAMSKSLQMTSSEKPSRNTAVALVIEDRLSGDFGNKFGSRDRTPLIASSSASFTNQLFYPIEPEDFGDVSVLSRYDVLINGQRFPFTIAGFRTITLPDGQGSFARCSDPHPTDTRCWDPTCNSNNGCIHLQKFVQNFPNSGFKTTGNFDLYFDGTDPVPPAKKTPVVPGGPMVFMWQWQAVSAVGALSTTEPIDVDGDFYPEQVVSSSTYGSDGSGRTATVRVIDRQAGDLDFTLDGRHPDVKVGLLPESQMYSFTRNGTIFRIREGKLYDLRSDQYVRNTNLNDQVDVVQRVFQLSNDTGRFCNGSTPRATVDGAPNPVVACGNCFSSANVDKTCFDLESLKLYVRSSIVNRSGRNWFTRTEVTP